jgi:glutamate-1-semialdehyde 2,1-aminomutase
MDYLSPDGPVYQAGTLSGNPLAMAAGLAQLRELDRVNGWSRLEELGAAFEAATRSALKRAGRDYVFQRIGSMFCIYFTPGEVWNLGDAQRSDRDGFARYFHACLEAGVYFAPSQFEAGFLSLAHTLEDLERTAAVVTKALAA